MLNIKFIRENHDLISEAARKKSLSFDVKKLLAVDEKRREALQGVEELRSGANKTADTIAGMADTEEKQRAIEDARTAKERLIKQEADLKVLEQDFRRLMLEVPNIPDPSVPEGKSDTENVEIRKWGDLPVFNFSPRNHLTLMQELDMLEAERGAKVSGMRGIFLKNDGFLLSMALWQWTVSELVKKDFIPVLAPALVREFNLEGTGWFPQARDDIYKTQDDLYLSGTAEVPMMGFHSDETLREEDLPKKYVAFSPCFRREAGSYGKDTKGTFRLHEFYKVEQVVLCKADHQTSVQFHEMLTENSETLMQQLKMPYRVVVNCGGDLGLGQVKKYDIEAWIPSEQRYRETHSASYFHDFQTRRLNIRYKDTEGTVRFMHSLNNTVMATPRILLALLENNQNADGSVNIPEVLRPYIGKDTISKQSR